MKGQLMSFFNLALLTQDDAGGAAGVAIGGLVKHYFAFFKNATRSANSCVVSCLSSPAGITDTVLGRISSTSLRATRTSWFGPVEMSSSDAVSLRISPFTTRPSTVTTATGS